MEQGKASAHIALAAMDIQESVVEPLKEFAKDSKQLVMKCTKPDRKGAPPAPTAPLRTPHRPAAPPRAVRLRPVGAGTVLSARFPRRCPPPPRAHALPAQSSPASPSPLALASW